MAGMSYPMVRKRIREVGYERLMDDIQGKAQLSYFGHLAHYKQGAKYLTGLELEWRRELAGFRLGSWKYKSRRDEHGTKICVICEQSAETERHLLYECMGLNGIRAKYGIDESKWDVWNDMKETEQLMIANYIRSIMSIRNERM